MSLVFRSLQPQEYLRKHIEAGSRPDGRKLTERRPISISSGHIKSADGSSIVRQGNTTVVCGIKLELAKPTAENPEQGFIVPNVTIPAMCNPGFKSGPPSAEAQALSTFIKEVISSSGCVDLRDLCPVAGRSAWVLYLDVICLDHDGNLRDAAVAALMAALGSLKLPTVVFDSEMEQISVTKDLSCLPMNSRAVSCSFCVFDQDLVADPTWEEETNAQSAVTLVILDSGDICLTEQTGASALSGDTFQTAVSCAANQAKEIQRALDSLR